MKARPIVGAHGPGHEPRALGGGGYRLTPYELGEDESLSPRQLEVIALYADGLIGKEVALRLGISHWTVDQYVRVARRKLGRHTVAGCVAECFRRGLIT